ncbi:MAG: VCBS repeat-containing protein, partial [Pseudomonadota bacterium]
MFSIAYPGHKLVPRCVVACATTIVGLLLCATTAQAQSGPELLDRSAQRLSGLANDSTTKSLEIGDFNQDGFEDLLVARREGNAVLLINQNGVLTNRTADFVANQANTSGANYAESFDANADGFPDLAIARPGSPGMLLLNLGNNGNGDWLGFDTGTALPAADNGLVIESGDINDDGAIDLFVIQVENQTN